MIAFHPAHSLPDNSFVEAMEGHREAIVAVAKNVYANSTASIRIDWLRKGCWGAVVEVPLENFVYSAFIEQWTWQGRSDLDLGTLLQARLGEVMKAQDKFSHRVLDVHSKIIPSLKRNGDMRLVTLQMQPASIQFPFNWLENRFIVEIEALNEQLAIDTVSLCAFTAREFAGLFRSWGKDHQRRLGRLERLSKNGAIFEIDRPTEEFICNRGLSIGLIAAIVKDWRTGEVLGERYGLKEQLTRVRNYEGLIYLADTPRSRAKRRYISESELEPLPL